MKTSNKIFIGTLGLFFLLGLTFMLFMRSNLHPVEMIDGEGELTTKAYDFKEYNDLYLSGNFNYEIVADTHLVEVITNPNIQELVLVTQDKGRLYVKESNKPYQLKDRERLTVRIGIKNIRRLSFKGSGTLMTTQNIEGDNIEISKSGSGSMKLQLAVGYAQIDVRGSGYLKLEGESTTTKITKRDSGDLDCKELATVFSTIDQDGSGSLSIQVSQLLEARHYGSGNLNYYGNPKQVNKTSDGSGGVYGH